MEENTIWKDMVQEDIEEDKNIDKKDRIKKIICVILGICIGALLTGVYVSQRAMEVDARISKMQGNLSKEVFRFHVLADSDSDEAQRVKLKVRDEVLEYMKQTMPGNEDMVSASQTKKWAKEHLREIEDVAKLVVFCNAPDDNPFMAGAFHGVTEADAIINVGVSGPGVVKVALEKARGKNFEVLCETIKKTAFKITRVGQLVAQEASRRLNIPFGIIDLSLAPTPAVGDSVAEILQEIGLERVGAPGTTAALAMLNDQVKKGGVMASSYVGGLSGAFIPVSEDQGMIDAVNAGALTLEKLEAMTCVCSVGLDMIAVPGDTKETTIAGIIADEAAIGMINQKTTAVRIIPVIGKGVGEVVEFGGLLGYAPIMPVNPFSCEKFVTRGGRIPAPIHSFKN